jgi:hypothetical protein
MFSAVSDEAELLLVESGVEILRAQQAGWRLICPFLGDNSSSSEFRHPTSRLNLALVDVLGELEPGE